jgi:hypothetical protein
MNETKKEPGEIVAGSTVQDALVARGFRWLLSGTHAPCGTWQTEFFLADASSGALVFKAMFATESAPHEIIEWPFDALAYGDGPEGVASVDAVRLFDVVVAGAAGEFGVTNHAANLDVSTAEIFQLSQYRTP